MDDKRLDLTLVIGELGRLGDSALFLGRSTPAPDGSGGLGGDREFLSTRRGLDLWVDPARRAESPRLARTESDACTSLRYKPSAKCECVCEGERAKDCR